MITAYTNLPPDPAGATTPAATAKIARRPLARRHQQLSAEIADLDELPEPLGAAINPDLLGVPGVGTDIAGQSLVTAGKNHQPITGETAFTMLCGVAPLPASNGKPAGAGSTTAATGKPTPLSTGSRSAACAGTPAPLRRATHQGPKKETMRC